jgi:DNA-binding NarL/FixJ family response regulator
VAVRTAVALIVCDDDRTMSVLIVDDHATFRRVARTVLEEAGYLVIGEAADGESALKAAAELAPALVLLDVQLPDLDGFEVAARLTASPDGPAVVLVSSRDAAEYGSLIDECGARGFLPKDELSGASLEALLR